MLFLNGLPKFYHPTFNFSHLASATDDKFLLVVEASDPKFDVEEVRTCSDEIGAINTEVVEA